MGRIAHTFGLAALAALAGPAAAQDEGADTLELPTLMVTALAAAEQGLTPETSTLGAKIDTPVEFIPQSISIVTQGQLQQRQPQSIDQAVAYVPGVVPSPWGMDSRFPQFLIRGFDVGTYGMFRDSLSQKAIGFSGFNVEPYTLERVEVLRGPSGVLYGETNPGGIVNAVTKRPVWERLRSGFVSYGSFDTVQAGFDVGGPLGQADALAFRLTGFYRDGETSVANSANDRALIAPAVTFEPTDETTVTILANFQRDKTSPAMYLPVAGEDYLGWVGDLPARAWDTLPEGTHFDADVDSIGYVFEHQLTDSVLLRQNFRAAEQRTDYREFYFNGMLTDDDGVVSDDMMNYADFSVKETARTVALDNQVEYAFSLGQVRNVLLLGADYYRARADSRNGWDASYAIPIVDPDFDFARPAPEIYQDGVQNIEQFGLYFHNQARITDRLLASFGLRQAWVKNTFDDNLYGGAMDDRQDDDKLVGDIGFVYELPNGLLPYASYSTGFITNVGTDFYGNMQEPTEAEQYEIGARYRPQGFDALFSAALYQITKTNVLTVDPAHAGYWVQTGEVRHRGLELEADVTLAEGLSAVASYSYIHAEITSSNDGDEGNVPAMVPEHSGAIWANYDVLGGALQGLSFGAGLRYVGSSYGDTSNARKTPARTTIDAALRYARGAIEGAVNVTNLFDKEYYAICYAGGGCTRGEERVVQAMLSFNF